MEKPIMYEVDTYKVGKSYATLLSTKYYKVNKELSKDIFIKRYKQFLIISFTKLIDYERAYSTSC